MALLYKKRLIFFGLRNFLSFGGWWHHIISYPCPQISCWIFAIELNGPVLQHVVYHGLHSFTIPNPLNSRWIISNIMFLWSEMMQCISPQTIPQNPIRQWRLSAAAWVPLLGWVLWSDPRAPPPRKRSISGSVPNPIARCKHGCIFEVAPKTRPTWCGLGQGEHAHVHYRFNIRKRQVREVLPQPTKHTHT